LFFIALAFKKNLKALLLSFIGSVAGFLAISFLLVPNWISEWINRILLYPSYTGGNIAITPLLKLFLSPASFKIVYLICFIILAGILVFLFWKWYKGEFSTLALLAFSGFFTFFFHPHGNSYEQLTFLIPFILWIIQFSRKHVTKAAIAWSVLVCLSWAIFFVGRFGILPEASTNGLYVVYIIWLTFGIILPSRFLMEWK
jgi:hypothetical protein